MALYRKECGWWLFLCSMCLMLFACGGGGSNTGTTNNPNIEDTYFKNITSFSLPSQNGPVDGVINGNKISITMPYGTDLTSLVATFTTDGSSVNIGGITQISGTTSNNFTSPVVYVVTAADGSTQSYTVTVTVAPKSAKAITAYSLNGTDGVIDGQNIAVTMPFGTDVTALVATFTTSGKNVAVGGTAQVSEVTPNNFTSPVIYVVTAADGSTQSYTVTVTVAPKSAKAITAYSLNGTDGVIDGQNIAVTMPYGTTVTALVATFTTSGKNVTVGGTAQVSEVTPNNFTNPVVYVVTAADGSTQSYTVTVTVAPKSAKAITAYSLNGTDGVIDGQNIAVTMPYGTTVTALVATFTTSGENVTVGGTAQVSEATPNNFTNPVVYVVTAADGSTQSYTVTVTVALNSAKAITAYSLNGTDGVITNKSIDVKMPFGTDVTALIATFTTDGQTVTVNGTTQVSTATPNDFTHTVVYVVTAADGSTEIYTVTVTVGIQVFDKPVGIALNSAGTIAYVTNYNSNTVSRCSVNPTTGAFSDCANTGGTGLLIPYGIALNSAGTIAYVTDVSDNTVTKCSVNPTTGNFSDCADTGGIGSYIAGIALNSAGTIAYLTDPAQSSVWRCTVNPTTGAFSACANTGGTGLYQPDGIALNNAGTIAYVIAGNTVTRCTVNPTTGAFSDCANTGGTGFKGTSGIVLNSTGTIAYVSDDVSSTVSRCSVNPTTGAFSDCANTGGTGFSDPFGIVLNSTGTIAYVTNASNNTVSRCSVNPTTGAFSACAYTGS